MGEVDKAVLSEWITHNPDVLAAALDPVDYPAIYFDCGDQNHFFMYLHTTKTRIVHIRHGFEFLGYKSKRGSRPLRLTPWKIRSGVRSGALYAYPRQKSLDHFKEQIRRRTRSKVPLTTDALIQELNPVIRGWGNYYCRAHVRKLFNQLDRWIVRRLWSHRYKRWRCRGWNTLSTARLRSELGLVSLVSLIPSLKPRH